MKYTDSVDLSSNYYNQTENDNLLANKVSTTGDTTISGKLGVGISPYDSLHIVGTVRIEPITSPTTSSHGVLVFDKSSSTDFGSNSYPINAYGRNGDGNSNLKTYNSRSG